MLKKSPPSKQSATMAWPSDSILMTQLSLLQDAESAPLPENRDLLTVAIPPLDGQYLYAFNATECPEVALGSIIEVPLGRRMVPAFILSANSEREQAAAIEMAARKVKIRSIPPSTTPIKAFNPEHLPFLEWIAKYHSEPLSKVLDLAVPSPSFGRADPSYTLTTAAEVPRLGPSQRRVYDYLGTHPAPTPLSILRAECGASTSLIRALLQKGLIVEAGGDTQTKKQLPQAVGESKWESLTEEQQEATSAIQRHVTEHTFASFLLHGVTGSGKTEVYLELVIEALKNGRSALIIVPEIALTPQLIDRFESRLGQRVAVLHSSIRPQARWEHWSSALSGDLKVVIGARSAIFAPMKDLGIIVVDEEHDSSFKQGEGIRYNGRDLAVVRAKLSSCPIVLGSATPSLESFHHARSGKHTLLSLGRRFFNSRPLSYQVIDLNKLKPWEMPSRNVSPALLSALEDTLKEKGQAFILYNRRGFASYLQCTSCEHVVGCPHCSVTLTFHRKTNSLLCHFCGYSTPPPVACSNCGGKDTPVAEGDEKAEPLFKHRGSGTERVFEELSALLPEARIEKLDRDAVKTLDDYIAVLRKVRSGEVDILVGTQMIAKGHDLPNVNFVGIVDCDVGLHVPDFRAAERAFQLLTQVSGRAGRREKQGKIVLQTRVPQHASLQMTIAGNYQGFAGEELRMRQMLGYPPFQRLLRIIVGAEEKFAAERIAIRIAASARTVCEELGVTVLGPAPAPVEKVRNFWRYHILCKALSAAKLQNLMHRLKLDAPQDKGSRVIFDLDPQDML